LHLRLTDSTNERARALAAAGAPSGTVVTADEQTAGRGRRGRRWSAPPGTALLYSALLRRLELEHVLLPLSVPLAVCEAVESLAPVESRIKWPNDVWLGERKLAGVLIEARPPEWAVIGVGVNLAVAEDEFPAGLRWPATSVGHDVSAAQARDALSAALGEWVAAPEERVLNAFGARDALLDREIGWTGDGSDGGEGTARGVDARGNLVVELADGARVSLGAGEVSLSLRQSA
jgi:BirA family biotin operon repressor/biotin-[acetyl-CoA-carboxylase] ligase